MTATMTDIKTSFKATIQAGFPAVMDLVQQLYDNPEIGGEEFFAHDLLSGFLEEHGFTVTRNVGMPTGFLGSYGDPSTGPVIALCAEYDALPGIGHGCGHNHFGGMSILAALGLKEVVDQSGGQILLVGTPAEENLGGKIKQTEAGVFDGVDAALMIHPSTKNGLGGKTQALNPVKFEFFGKSAHGCRPMEGASALDAAVLAFTSINFMRQFVPDGTFIHGVIKDGGQAANVIPEYASLEYYFRAPKMADALKMSDDAVKRAQAAAEACGVKMESSIYECPYGEILLNEPLADLMKEAFEEVGLKDIEPIDDKPVGSSDVGAVSFVCPTVHATIKIAADDVAGHSKEMADATISPEGQQALKDGAKSLAIAAHRLLTDTEALAKCQEDHKVQLAAAEP